MTRPASPNNVVYIKPGSREFCAAYRRNGDEVPYSVRADATTIIAIVSYGMLCVTVGVASAMVLLVTMRGGL